MRKVFFCSVRGILVMAWEGTVTADVGNNHVGDTICKRITNSQPRSRLYLLPSSLGRNRLARTFRRRARKQFPPDLVGQRKDARADRGAVSAVFAAGVLVELPCITLMLPRDLPFSP